MSILTSSEIIFSGFILLVLGSFMMRILGNPKRYGIRKHQDIDNLLRGPTSVNEDLKHYKNEHLKYRKEGILRIFFIVVTLIGSIMFFLGFFI